MPRDDPGPWRRMRLWAAAHAIDDMYQGLVPASVPYFVLDRHYTYVAASGLALAATLGSSLPQPVIGMLVDKWRLGWMAAAGVSLAGVGARLSGLAPAAAWPARHWPASSRAGWPGPRSAGGWPSGSGWSAPCNSGPSPWCPRWSC